MAFAQLDNITNFVEQTVTIRHYLKRLMAKSKAKILVVDDNSGIRAALKLLLPMHFAEVELTAKGTYQPNGRIQA